MGPSSAKARAWDLIGERYWNSGYYGGPAPEHWREFRRLLRPGARTAVVGASTVSLSEAAVVAGADVHVLDFAPGILAAAGRRLGLAEDRRHLVDVTRPIPPDLRGAYDVVLADRLANRFSAADLPAGLRGLRDLTATVGVLGITVRFGLYERDRAILAALSGSERCAFWNPAKGEVDYGALPDRDLPLPVWGRIAAQVIREHLRARGREARFSREELVHHVEQLDDLHRTCAVTDSGGTELMIFTRERWP
jgi:hypothetical protein